MGVVIGRNGSESLGAGGGFGIRKVPGRSKVKAGFTACFRWMVASCLEDQVCEIKDSG